MSNFLELLRKAQYGDQGAAMDIISLYSGLLQKYSKINGFYDEDLYHLLIQTILDSIQRFKV